MVWQIFNCRRWSLRAGCRTPGFQNCFSKPHNLYYEIIIFMEGPKPEAAAVAVEEEGLVRCLAEKGIENFTASGFDFEDRLKFSIQNLRYAESNVLKPSVLILPRSKREVQAAVTCCRQQSLELRVRSGGHGYEGTSCTAEAPFAIIDLMNLNAVKVDVPSQTAWVEAGATLGEIYYAISQASPGYGFSAGSCPTVGSGGHISGGGFGFMSRKYGLAADNVVDAELVNGNGVLVNRKSMGEELFWAIRGGGGGCWGVVVAWKVKLLPVPPVVTVFNVSRLGLDTVTNLIYKWQTIAPNLEEEFYVSAFVGASLPEAPNQGISASFKGMYLGSKTTLLKSITSRFPELGIESHDCKEVTWIQSILFFSGLSPVQISDIKNLRDRELSDKNYFYAKSDYVRNPIPESDILGACKILQQEPRGYIIMDPYGGKMTEAKSNALPFPHRAGNLYGIQYLVAWYDRNNNEGNYIAWLRKFYSYMTPYVSKNPRAAYVNYMDLDLGTMALLSNDTSPVDIARRWGEKYFLGNFERLVQLKTRFDPENVFRNLQSIPPDVLPESARDSF